MRKVLLLLSCITLFALISTREVSAAHAVFGSNPKLVKICDLPDTEANTSSDGKYFDFGYKYTVFEVIFLPIFEQGEGSIVGYIDDDNFVLLAADDIQDIVKTNEITNLAGMVKIPFWDAWGGKIAAIAIVLLLIIWRTKGRHRKMKA